MTIVPISKNESARRQGGGWKFSVAGHGVGLALWKRVGEAYHGWAWAESAVGKESVFHFSLPADGRRDRVRGIKMERSLA